ncbi:hypothetical protein H8I69_23230 [Serratia fonticola]|uniref:hypothetical protein n=1 Tax=Serratia fonticola TaxID=47917 RepID=UPI0015C5A511|nr:hypothetical protein [Serratia fonticola]MBC3382032.1 hypothetical protein [Serratia fonticola]NYA41231.1 hypothetical protein [Serratia fonticola]
MKAYLTKNNILVTLYTLEVFIKAVFNIPFYGPKHLRRPFYGDIARFLEHLICCATVSRNTRKKARFKGDKDWTYSVPLPAETLGKRELPRVFKQPKDLPHTRALELIEEAGLVKIIDYTHSGRKCREFAVSKQFLHSLFTKDRAKYLRRTDRLSYLTNIFNKRKTYSFDELIGQAISRGCQAVKHQLSKRDISNEPFRNMLKAVWGNVEPLHINLDALRQYVDTHHSTKNTMFYRSFLSHLAEVGVELISDTPLVVAYRQSYKSAKIGGRSFEVGTGFQSLPSGMKWACLAKGYNYDIKGCQLDILRRELQLIGVSDNNLQLLDTEVICKKLGVKDALVKQFRYASVFNAGYVSLSFKSATVRLLRKAFGPSKAKHILLRWREHLEPLKADLARLLDHYEATARTNRYGRCVTNAVGQTFNCTYKLVKTGKRWRNDVMRRKLLAHMLQGLESRAVYQFVREHPGLVCALEHDGFVSYEKIADEDWQHPFLKIILKH